MDASIETHSTRMNVDRMFARGFVIAGGLFWSVASFAALYSFMGSSASAALLAAFYPLAATGATLAIGWYYERTASALLTLGSVAVVVWGVLASWEIGVWILMVLFMIVPMATAASLFMMARREQMAYELAIARHAELATVEATIN